MSVQTILIWIIGISAAAYVARLFLNTFRGKEGCGCSGGSSGCKGCPGKLDDQK